MDFLDECFFFFDFLLSELELELLELLLLLLLDDEEDEEEVEDEEVPDRLKAKRKL